MSVDDGCWKQAWAEMTDSELNDRLFTDLGLVLHIPNANAGRVTRLIQEVERRELAGNVDTLTAAPSHLQPECGLLLNSRPALLPEGTQSSLLLHDTRISPH